MIGHQCCSSGNEGVSYSYNLNQIVFIFKNKKGIIEIKNSKPIAFNI